MANILICYCSIAGNSKYQDLANSLYDNGNNVLQFNTNGHTNTYLKKIELFNPDIVFSYNNSLPKKLFLELNCPILIVDADNPEMFFQKKLLQDHYQKENIFFLLYQSNSQNLYSKILHIDVKGKNILFPPSTGFTSDLTTDPMINISFIGSNFYSNYHNLHINNIDEFLECANNIKQTYYNHAYLSKHFSNDVINNAKYIKSGQDRLSYLSVITDLGLSIYSNSNWKEEVIYIDTEIADCFVNQMINTDIENNNLYNNSKIAINLSHPQAINSFSWRVPDIMASNACLVMEYKKDWEDIFGKFISSEVKNSIIYRDRYDMRNKCIKLLNDTDLRLKCVKECQFAIEKNGRWNHRIAEIEKLINIKLLDNKTINNKTIDNKTIDNKTIDKEIKKTNYIKNVYYSLYVLIFSTTKGALCSKKKYIKFLQKMLNYIS